jgi:glycine betaine transporter
MSLIISAAYLAVLLSALFVIFRWGNVTCLGPTPVNTFTLVALLFTAGLDMGLVMLPLTEFPVYAADAAYGFANPLSIEFGMWGPLVWMMYFLSTFYFVILEPKLKIFEVPSVKWVYNLTIIATCAFTCYLFLTALPSYIPSLPLWGRWLLAIAVIMISVHSSSDVNFMKWLAILSTWMFGILTFVALVAVAYFNSGAGLSAFAENLLQLSDYFTNLHRFVTPITSYHEFYLFWWFSWSIMIGQFVSGFVGGLRAWTLAGAMVILPAIPLGVWFCVLYVYFDQRIVIPDWLNWFMVVVGVIFVVNSLDSLIRLYGRNLNWSVERLGRGRYYLLHFFIQFALVLAYQFTPFRIEWVGLVVIGIYALIYVTMIMRSHHVRDAIGSSRTPGLPKTLGSV